MNERIVRGAVVVLVVAAVVSGCGKSQRQKRIEEAAKQMERVAAELEAKAGNGQGDMAKAMDAMSKAMEASANASTGKVELIDFRELKALLPESIGSLKRGDMQGERTAAFGISVAKAEARYESENGESSIHIELTDMGGVGGFAAFAQVGWAAAEVDRETDTGYEKTTTIGGHRAHEQFDNENKSGQLQVLVKGRILVDVNGQGVDMAAIKSAIEGVNLGKVAGLVK